MAIAFVTSGNHTSTTSAAVITKAGSAGDIQIAAITASDATVGTAIGAFTWGSGWNVLDGQEANVASVQRVRTEIAWRLRDAGDPDTWSVTCGVSNDGSAAAWSVYSGVHTTTPVVDSGFATMLTSSDPAGTHATPTVTEA